MTSADEEDSIFDSNFVVRRSSPPRSRDNDSLITMDRSTANSSNNNNYRSDDEERSAAPSLDDLTSVASRPDSRSRSRLGRSGASSYGRISDHSGSTRKASHTPHEVEAQGRRRRSGKEELLYKEESSAEDKNDGGGSILTYFSAFRGHANGAGGRRDGDGYSSLRHCEDSARLRSRSGGNDKKLRGNVIVGSVIGVFEGINVKTVYCVFWQWLWLCN